MAGEYDLNLSNGNVFATLYPLEINGPDSTSTPRLVQQARPSYSIDAVNAVSDTFTIAGDFTNVFRTGFIFEVVGSTGNDGSYTVSSSSFVGGNTEIITVEDFTNTTVDGDIIAHIFRLNSDVTYRFVSAFSFTVQNSGEIDGTYTVTSLGSIVDGTDTIIPVTHSTIRNNLIAPIVLPLGEIIYTVPSGTVSSLQLPGKGSINYGERLIENMLRMTENFAADSAPDSNAIIGTTPAATPLVGQLWYNTTVGSEGFSVWNGTGWTTDIDVDSGSHVFKDLENSNNDIHITAAETNLPAPWPGAANNQPGLVVWPQTDPADTNAIFRVLSSNGDERLRIEHHGTANSGFIRTVNNIESTATGTSSFYGSLAIGASGAPTLDKTLTVEGTGISVNSAAATDAILELNSPTGQQPIVEFKINDVLQGNINSDSGVSGTPLTINDGVTNNVNIVTGGGNVGIGVAVPSAKLDVGGTTELNGDVTVVASDLIVNTNHLYVDQTNSWVGVGVAIGSATDITDALEVNGNLRVKSTVLTAIGTNLLPSYAFDGDPNTGMYSTGADAIGIATNGTLRFTVSSTGLLTANTTNYETLVVGDDDIPNKKYVDDLVSSTSWREPVRVHDATLYANFAALPTGGVVDGVTLVDGDRVLFSNVTVIADRDLYIWNSTGSSWLADVPNPRTVGDTVYVSEGTYAANVFSFDELDKWEPLIGSGINVQYEQATASNGQTVFNLSSVRYAVATNRLHVFVDGVKQVLGAGAAYLETDVTTVTFNVPSPFVGGEIVEFYAYDELTARGVAKRETQTGLTGTPVITFSAMTYAISSDNLLVYLNGQKMVKDIDYTETTEASITWIGATLIASDYFEFYSTAPIVSGTKLRNVDDVSTATPVNNDTLVYNTSTSLWEPQSTPPSLGTEFDYQTGNTDTVTIVNTDITLTAMNAGRSYQQVFVNGILQREDVIGFPAGGNYYVSSSTVLAFSSGIVGPADEVIVYEINWSN